VAVDYPNSSADMIVGLDAGASRVILNNGAIANKYVGSAIVSGANATDRLFAIVNLQNLVAPGDTFYAYNRFNR
jgi:hypothetical protein